MKKAKLVSRESVLNTTIKAAIASLLKLVEQMTRGQYDAADALVLDLKRKMQQEYTDIASQEEQEAVEASITFQAEQGSKVRQIHTSLVRKMPAPEPLLQPANHVRPGAAQGQGAEGVAAQERQKLKLKPQEVPRFTSSAEPTQDSGGITWTLHILSFPNTSTS